MSTFTWKPAPGASCEVKPNVNVIKFGDGYEQRVASGINNRLSKWSLKFTTHVPEILDFLELCNAETSFQWTDPLGKVGQYVCREWKPAHVGVDLFELTCEFEQVPA